MREVKIYIDDEKQRLVYSPIILTQYQSAGTVFKFIKGLPTKSLENEVPFDTETVVDEEVVNEITIRSIRFVLPNSDEVIDSVDSELYRLPNECTSYNGSVSFELYVNFEDGVEVPLSGEFYVQASNYQDPEILRDDRYPILTKLINQVTGLLNDVSELNALKDELEDIYLKLKDIDMESILVALAEINDKLDNLDERVTELEEGDE